ncbi:MAG: hypothetical protein Q8L90_13790 [Bacteroidota bacterium]|nr:hypothetical protein [Bacteroidota bacterium]
MKFFFNLFVLLLFISNAHNFVEKKHVCSEKQSSVGNAIESPLDAMSEDNVRSVNQDSSDGIPHKQKKRNRKGVKSVLFCIGNESIQGVNSIETHSLFVHEESQYSQPFPANGKRGPPTGYSIS